MSPSAPPSTTSPHRYLRRAARASFPHFEPADEQGRRRGRSPSLSGRRTGRAWRKVEGERKVRSPMALFDEWMGWALTRALLSPVDMLLSPFCREEKPLID